MDSTLRHWGAMGGKCPHQTYLAEGSLRLQNTEEPTKERVELEKPGESNAELDNESGRQQASS